MREDIKREISKLKETIIYCIDFYLQSFDKENRLYDEDDTELLYFGINTLKDVKQLTNGQQRFLKSLLKFQEKKKRRMKEK